MTAVGKCLSDSDRAVVLEWLTSLGRLGGAAGDLNSPLSAAVENPKKKCQWFVSVGLLACISTLFSSLCQEAAQDTHKL